MVSPTFRLGLPTSINIITTIPTDRTTTQPDLDNSLSGHSPLCQVDNWTNLDELHSSRVSVHSLHLLVGRHMKQWCLPDMKGLTILTLFRSYASTLGAVTSQLSCNPDGFSIPKLHRVGPLTRKLQGLRNDQPLSPLWGHACTSLQMPTLFLIKSASRVLHIK